MVSNSIDTLPARIIHSGLSHSAKRDLSAMLVLTEAVWAVYGRNRMESIKPNLTQHFCHRMDTRGKCG